MQVRFGPDIPRIALPPRGPRYISSRTKYYAGHSLKKLRNCRVPHRPVNRGLGQANRTYFDVGKARLIVAAVTVMTAVADPFGVTTCSLTRPAIPLGSIRLS